MEKIILSPDYPSNLGARKAVEQALIVLTLVLLACIICIIVSGSTEVTVAAIVIIIAAIAYVAYRGWYGRSNPEYQIKCLYAEIAQYKESITLRQHEKDELREYGALPAIQKKDDEWIRFYEGQIDQLEGLIQRLSPLVT
jgi:hypothetical protein